MIRSNRRLGIVAIALLAAACTPEFPGGTETTQADLIFLNGAIYTLDANRAWAEAIAVTNGRISYVGSDQGAAALQGSGTRVVDLDGRMMLPAFQDMHIHPISGGIEAAACDLNGAGSLEAYLDIVARCAVADPAQDWILGGGWSMSVFGPGAMPSRRLLDAIVPDRPVYLSSSDGHTAWVNSRALELAGVSATTPDPAGGRIDRDPLTREAIGSLQETAMGIVGAHTPQPSPEMRIAGLRRAMEMLNGYGITAIQDASVREADLDAYRALDERGELTLRVVGSLWWERERGSEQIDEFRVLRDRFTKGRLRATTVKIMQDGVMENFTAAVLEPYIGQRGNRGMPMIEPDALERIVTALDATGFQVHFHAIGDAAIRQSLDAVEAAREHNGDRGNRHHISHLQLIDPADIPRFRELGVVANFQPLWAYADEYITELTVPFIGPERSRWLYAIASVARAGGMVAFGSDWSVSSANPFEQIETALLRTDALDDDDVAFIPEERIDLPLALAAFTINAAFVNASEQQTGSIEPGKLADLIVLDRNLFEIDPRAISETRVVLTLLEGAAVHGNLTQF